MLQSSSNGRYLKVTEFDDRRFQEQHAPRAARTSGYLKVTVFVDRCRSSQLTIVNANNVITLFSPQAGIAEIVIGGFSSRDSCDRNF